MRGRPRASALIMVHQIDPICMPQLADAGRLEADQNGGTARVLSQTIGYGL